MTTEPERIDLARNTWVMTSGTLLSRATGLVRLIALAAAFGAAESALADAYNVANVAPNLVYELVLGGVLSSVLVPVFVETMAGDDADHRHIVNTVTTLAGSVLIAIALVAIVAAPALATMLTLGAEGRPADVERLRDVVTVLLRFFLPQLVFYGFTTIWTAYLNAHRHFAAPMFAPVLNNLVVTCVVLAFAAAVRFEAVELGALTSGQLTLLGLGTTAGIAAMTVALWPVARRHGWSYRPTFDWRHPMVARIRRLGGWTLLYVATNQIGYLVVVLLTSELQGSYTAYTYAFVFFQLPHGLYAVSVMTALVPAMAQAATAGDLETFREHLVRGVRTTALLIVPAAVGLAVLAEPLVRLGLERGAWSAESTALTHPVLAAFALGLASFSLFQLFLRAHYALQDTRTPVFVNIAAVGLNIVLDVVLFMALPEDWKIVGLALGHAAAYTLGAALFARGLSRRAGNLGGSQTRRALLRIGAASAGMGVLAWGVATGLAAVLDTDDLPGRLIQVGASVGVGALAYWGLARLLRVEDLAGITSVLRRRE